MSPKRWLLEPHSKGARSYKTFFPGWRFTRRHGDYKYVIGGFTDVRDCTTAREAALFILLTRGREYGKAP